MERTQSKKSLLGVLEKILAHRRNADGAKSGIMTRCNGYSESIRHRGVKANKRLALKLRNIRKFKNQNKKRRTVQ